MKHFFAILARRPTQAMYVPSPRAGQGVVGVHTTTALVIPERTTGTLSLAPDLKLMNERWLSLVCEPFVKVIRELSVSKKQPMQKPRVSHGDFWRNGKWYQKEERKTYAK
jgi:hypothetical protein